MAPVGHPARAALHPGALLCLLVWLCLLGGDSAVGGTLHLLRPIQLRMPGLDGLCRSHFASWCCGVGTSNPTVPGPSRTHRRITSSPYSWLVQKVPHGNLLLRVSGFAEEDQRVTLVSSAQMRCCSAQHCNSATCQCLCCAAGEPAGCASARVCCCWVCTGQLGRLSLQSCHSGIRTHSPAPCCFACTLVQELPGMAGQMKASVREGLRQGVAGAVRDLQVGWLSIKCCSAFAGIGWTCDKWRSDSFCRRGLSCAHPCLLPPASVLTDVRPCLHLLLS